MIYKHAEMAELADAHGSGPCGSNTMRVQVPFSAVVKDAINMAEMPYLSHLLMQYLRKFFSHRSKNGCFS